MEDPRVNELLAIGSDWGWAVGVLVGAALLGLLVYVLLDRILRSITHRAPGALPLQGALLRRLPGPLRLLLPTLFVYVALPFVRDLIPPDAASILNGLLYALFIAAATWLLVALMYAGEEAVGKQYATDVPDNLKARKIVTQVRILRRIATTIVIVLAIGIVLLQYDPFRQFGAGILASAGIVGIIVGVAAQNTLGDLIAGIQIALTQPIRVDDVVIVEGEFGWVEEITLTYVVVRVWDRRRVVMPITHFVEKPFQNWTRTSSDLIGTVFLYVDYRTPVGEIRDELHRVVEKSEYWDGDVRALQVTDTSEHSIELRAIASAESAPQLWELRCEIREKLIAYLRDRHPEALPVVRARLEERDQETNSEGTSSP